MSALSERKSALRLVVEEPEPPAPPPGRRQFSTTPATDTLGWSRAIAAYLRHCRATKAAKTAHYYQERLRVVRAWMITEARDGAGVPLDDLRRTDVDEFLEYRLTCKNHQGLQISDSTRKADIIALKAFLKWAKAEDLIDKNRLRDYRPPTADEPSIPTPSVDVLGRLLSGVRARWSVSANPKARFLSPAARRFYKVRQFAIITGLVALGLRIGELLDLRVDDVDVDARVVRVRKSKGNTTRDVPFEEAWLRIVVDGEEISPLGDWLKIRRGAPTDLLFYTDDFTRILYKPWLHMWYRDLEFAGLKGTLTPHMLRHYSTDVVFEVSTKAAQQRAGHRDVRTTQRYVGRRLDHVRDAVERSAPLGAALSAMGANGGKAEPQKRRRAY